MSRLFKIIKTSLLAIKPIAQLNQLRLAEKERLAKQHELNVAINLLATGYHAQLALLHQHDARSSYQNAVVSLTSYGTRVNDVHLTVLSLLTQTVKVENIILWLAADEFTLSQLPESLLILQTFGLSIQFCPDLKSYKKLIPTLQQQQNKTIITFDDDVLYPSDHIERLLNTQQAFPHCVVCHRAHRLLKQANGEIAPYNKWQFDVAEDKPRADLFPIGIGGVLYPAGCFDNDIFNQTEFMNIAGSADDLWFKTMALKNNRLTKVVDNPMPYLDYLAIPSATQQTLWQQNSDKNDQQLQAILQRYPNVTFE